MKVISVVNYKGGVGKSTVVSNLGALLTLKGKRILLIDLDPQASLTFSYMTVDDWEKKYKDEKTIKTWFNEIINGDLTSLERYITKDLNANKTIRSNGGKMISLIPSHTELYKIQIELARKTQGRNKRGIMKNSLMWISKLAKGIEEISDKYDYIILDCQPSFDIITQSAIYASDYYLIPTKLDYISTVGVPTLLDHVKNLSNEVKEGINQYDFKRYKYINIKLLGALPTMVKNYDGHIKKLNMQYRKELVDQGIGVFKSTIRDNEGEIDNNTGLPFVLSGITRKKSNIYNDFERFVEECERIMGESNG